ncbi:MAG: MBL fold metallo-hydrolase [Lachnospiraceae bacterium]|nr:MBL fold metallo-hydrolase [Lachnospiraceae bacterium]
MIDKIEVNTQNSIRISSSVGTIYIDPLEIPDKKHDADFILITHDHGDHFSPEDIRRVAKADTILIVPGKMLGKAQQVADSVGRIETVKPAGHWEIKALEFETVPSYNLLKPFHPKSAEWVGYVLKIDGKRIYIAGDTDATKEAKAVKCDIAIVPIGGTYTMDAKKAAELVNTICPDIAVPVHYGSIVGKPSDGDVFAANVKSGIKVEEKIEF